MYEDFSKIKLTVPLSKQMVDFIKQEHPDFGAFIVSTIEFTIKESENHYSDLLRSLEPLLKERTKNFVTKIFMFKRRQCNDGSNCIRQNCIFLHDNLKENNPSKRVSFDLPSTKKTKNVNKEVVFNKVDETKYNLENIREYASKYGSVVLLRRLNRGKYLIIYETPESAQDLVEATESVMEDKEIKKFYNVMANLDQHKKQDIMNLLQTQKELLDTLAQKYDLEAMNTLKQLTQRIRNYIMNKEGKQELKPSSKKEKDNGPDSNAEGSLYSTMFQN